jgi:hypothetical protein
VTELALSTDQAKVAGIGVIVALLVIGLIVMLVIRAIVGKIIVAVLAIGLAVLVYTQRAQIKDATSDCHVSFFGINLTPSDPQVKQFCADQLNP